jgi:hypothetical protein
MMGWSRLLVATIAAGISCMNAAPRPAVLRGLERGSVLLQASSDYVNAIVDPKSGARADAEIVARASLANQFPKIDVESWQIVISTPRSHHRQLQDGAQQIVIEYQVRCGQGQMTIDCGSVKEMLSNNRLQSANAIISAVNSAAVAAGFNQAIVVSTALEIASTMSAPSTVNIELPDGQNTESVWFTVDIEDDCGSAAITGSFNDWGFTPMEAMQDGGTVFSASVQIQRGSTVQFKFQKCGLLTEVLPPVDDDCVAQDDGTIACYAMGLETRDGITTRFVAVGAALTFPSGAWGKVFASVKVWLSVDIEDDCGSAAVTGSFNEWGMTPMHRYCGWESMNSDSVCDSGSTFVLGIDVALYDSMQYQFVKCGNVPESLPAVDISENADSWAAGYAAGCVGNPGDFSYECFARGAQTWISTLEFPDRVTVTNRFIGVGGADVGWPGQAAKMFGRHSDAVEVWLHVDVTDTTVCGAPTVQGTFSGWKDVTMIQHDDSNLWSVKLVLEASMPIEYQFMNGCEDSHGEELEEVTTNCFGTPNELGYRCISDGLISTPYFGTTYTQRYLGIGTENIGWPSSRPLLFGEADAAVTVYFKVDIEDDCGSAFVAGDFNGWNAIPMTQVVGSVYALAVEMQPNTAVHYSFIKCTEENWEVCF